MPSPARSDRPSGETSARAQVATVGDRFFRDMVASMRNGVLAVTREGAIAVMNDEAYRIFGMSPSPADIGRPYADVLRVHPDIVRVIASAFELNHLPNRVELRLKSTGKVIGYTLSLIRDEAGEISGAALFFKDLTQGRAARGTRAAARSPGGARRDGRGHGARAEEPAGGNRGDGRSAAPQGERIARRAVDHRGHHQRGQDGQLHRRRDARLRPAGAARTRAHGHCARAPHGRVDGREQGEARRGRA